jgi:glutamate dehydrogenase/leucine dehydrogenase
MSAAFNDVLTLSSDADISPREAAFRIAVGRVIEAAELRGMAGMTDVAS